MADRILTRQEMILLHLLQYIDVPVSGYVMDWWTACTPIRRAQRRG